MKWIKFSDKTPPINTDVLVLVDGRIFEGFLDSVVLMSDDKPTIFKTLYLSNYEHPQHTSWGDDPYWMPIPCEKPKQIKLKPPLYDVLKQEEI